MRRLDQSNAFGVGPGEGALSVAEQLGEREIGTQGPAVDRQERPLGARRGTVDRARDQLLAGPGLTRHQHGQLGGGGAARQHFHPLHRPRPRDQRRRAVAASHHRRDGRHRRRRIQEALELPLGVLEQIVDAELGEQGAGPVERPPRRARVALAASQQQQGAAQLVALAALVEQGHRGAPVLERILALAAGPRDLAADAERHRVLEPVVGAARQVAGAFAGLGRLVELLHGGQRLGPAAFDLHHQVALGRDVLGDSQRFVVTGQGALGLVAVEIELAQELQRQDLFASRVARAAAFEGAQQAALGLGMVALQACHVPHSDRDSREAQRLAHLEVDVLRFAIAIERPIPLALLLVDDAEVDERHAGVTESPQLPVDLERALEMSGGRVPLTQVLVDQSEVVAHGRTRRFVTDATMERERLFVEIPRPVELAEPVRDASQPVQRAGLQTQVAGRFGERQCALGALLAFVVAGETEQRVGRAQMKTGTDPQRVDRAFARQHVAALRERGHRVTLGQAAGDCLGLERCPARSRQASRLGGRKQALDGLERWEIAVRLEVQVGEHLHLRQSGRTTPSRRIGQPLFEIRDAISVVARHEMTPVERSIVAEASEGVLFPSGTGSLSSAPA